MFSLHKWGSWDRQVTHLARKEHSPWAWELKLFCNTALLLNWPHSSSPVGKSCFQVTCKMHPFWWNRVCTLHLTWKTFMKGWARLCKMIELPKDSEEISVLIVSRGMILFAFHPFLSKCLCAVLKWQSEGEGDFVVVGRCCCHCVFTARRSRLLCTQIMESQEAVTGAHMSYLKTAPPPEEHSLFRPLFFI